MCSSCEPTPQPEAAGPATQTNSFFDSVVTRGLSPAALIPACLPWLRAWIRKHPKLYRRVVLPLLAIGIAPALLSKLPAVWSYFCSYLLANDKIRTEDEDVLESFQKWLKKKLSAKIPERSVTTVSMGSFAKGKSVKFEGTNSFQTFTHNRRVFFVTTNTDKSVTIWTLHWTPQPIQALIDEIIEEERATSPPKIRIFTAAAGRWKLQTLRVQRSLSSIYLPSADKRKLVADLEIHLRNKTRLWFSERGIPYRRGYLLHGEPGCGKSSLSLALAGHFDLEGVYMLSLLNSGVTDETLLALFKGLPTGSVLLLEDIDAVGLDRDTKNKAVRSKTRSEGTKEKVSLAGLLNALDSAVSPEGHIVIMTTNKIDHLDPALIRPGRIDYRLEFKLANLEQISEIFAAMYRTPSEGAPLSDATLAELTESFSARIPEYTFTPAELQGYIMTHRFDAHEAVNEAEQWVKDQLEAKKAKTAPVPSSCDNTPQSSGQQAAPALRTASSSQAEDESQDNNESDSDDEEEQSETQGSPDMLMDYLETAVPDSYAAGDDDAVFTIADIPDEYLEEEALEAKDEIEELNMLRQDQRAEERFQDT